MKNIIFDLGGVILNIDYQKTEDKFVELGITNFGELFSQMKQSDLFDRLETGRIEVEEFYNEFREITGTPLSNDQIEDAWNEMLLDLPKERLDLLEQLKQKYNVYLFSNTNEIHLKAFNQIVKEQHGIESLDHLFITPYYSHIFGRRKPDASSFQELCDRECLNPSETLFIDDTIVHIEGAKSIGLQTYHLTDHPITELNHIWKL